MIPKVIPPLTGLSILVTRPLPQCETLCNAIRAAGGESISFPTIKIEAVSACVSATYDLAIFVSVNAVQHGIALFAQQPDIKLAAIGRATAAALRAAQRPPHIVPDMESNSESLLTHPELADAALRRVVIVRGDGGRELLRETLVARGIEVHSCEVYRRTVPDIGPETLEALEQQWADSGIDAVTLTSVETLQNLLRLLPEQSRARLQTATLIAASERIARAAREFGLSGPVINARGADDEAMLGALINWHTRARADLACGLD